MKPTRVLIQALIGGALFVTGVGGGIWFNEHYQIVPRNYANPPQTPTQPTIDATTPAPPVQTTLGARARDAVPAQPTQTAPATPPPLPDGPFAYRFVPNEHLVYRLQADIEGTGLDFGQGSPVAMTMDSGLSLVTESVDGFGNGSLRLTFDEVYMGGDFMGGPFELRHGPERTVMTMDGRPLVDTAQGQSTKGIPQLEFFQQPIRMKVAPDGRVLNVSGGAGLGTMLSPTQMLTPTQFPSPEFREGQQWESQFNLPVPGLGAAAPARALNTFIGRRVIRGRQCAVIRQELFSSQQDGTMASPKSVLGEGMEFTMPIFEVSGENWIYFDEGNGQLVECDMDMEFTLQLGEELKPVGDLLNLYSELFRELDGQPSPPSQQPEEKHPLLDLGAHIQGSLTLVQ